MRLRINSLMEWNSALEDERKQLKYTQIRMSKIYADKSLSYKNLTAQQMCYLDEYVENIKMGKTDWLPVTEKTYQYMKENEQLKQKLKIFEDINLLDFADKMRNFNSYDQTEQLKQIVEQLSDNRLGNTYASQTTSPQKQHKVNARFDGGTKVNARFDGGTMRTTGGLEGFDDDFKGTMHLGDNASHALQMHVVECLDLLNKREIAMKGMTLEIDRTHKTLRSCLIVQDKLMVDSFRQKRENDAALKEERFKVMEYETRIKTLESENKHLEDRLETVAKTMGMKSGEKKQLTDKDKIDEKVD